MSSPRWRKPRARWKPASPGGFSACPLDRVFTMRGFGTVVTGTSVSGSVRLGDTMMIYPQGLTAKVRGLQVHGVAVEEAMAGQRTAVNLQGLERERLERGNVLGPPDALSPSRRLDVSVEYIAANDKAIKNRTQVRFHVGTSEHLGRILLLDREELAPGETAPAQLLLDEPAVCLAGDRFVLRSYSPVRTIAGGEVLNPLAPRRKRFSDQTKHDLAVLQGGEPLEKLAVLIEGAGFAGINAAGLAGLIDLPSGVIKDSLGRLLSKREAIQYDKDRGRLIGRGSYDTLGGKVIEELEAFHKAYPLRPGMGKEELRSRIKGLSDQRLAANLLDHLASRGLVAVDRETARLAGHTVTLAGDVKTVEEGLIKAFADAGFTPPAIREVLETLPGSDPAKREVVDHLLKQGLLVKVKADLLYHREAIDTLWAKARESLKKDGDLTTQAFKEQTGLTRKYLIPVLEYFDAQGPDHARGRKTRATHRTPGVEQRPKKPAPYRPRYRKP